MANLRGNLLLCGLCALAAIATGLAILTAIGA